MKIIIIDDHGKTQQVFCRCAMVATAKNDACEPSVEYTGKLYGVYGSGDPEAMAKVAELAARRYEEIARGGM